MNVARAKANSFALDARPDCVGQSGRITQLARDRGATLEQVICNPLPLPRNVDR